MKRTALRSITEHKRMKGGVMGKKIKDMGMEEGDLRLRAFELPVWVRDGPGAGRPRRPCGWLVEDEYSCRIVAWGLGNPAIEA